MCVINDEKVKHSTRRGMAVLSMTIMGIALLFSRMGQTALFQEEYNG
jgi:hypothetical protein